MNPSKCMHNGCTMDGISCATDARFAAHLLSYQCSALLTTRLSCPNSQNSLLSSRPHGWLSQFTCIWLTSTSGPIMIASNSFVTLHPLTPNSPKSIMGATYKQLQRALYKQRAFCKQRAVCKQRAMYKQRAATSNVRAGCRSPNAERIAHKSALHPNVEIRSDWDSLFLFSFFSFVTSLCN